MPTKQNPVPTPILSQPDRAITATSKVTLGILGTGIVFSFTIAMWVYDFRSEIRGGVAKIHTVAVATGKSLEEVKQALDRNTAQLIHDGRSLVAVTVLVNELGRRVSQLEKRD